MDRTSNTERVGDGELIYIYIYKGAIKESKIRVQRKNSDADTWHARCSWTKAWGL